jgi:IS4 transposase
LDLRGNIPTFIWITDGKVHDVNALDHLVPEPGAIYVMDRAYLEFQRLYHMHQCSSIFVIRSKTNTGLRRFYSQKVDKTKNIICDQIIVPKGVNRHRDYPEKLRRIKFFDTEKGRIFFLLTNQITLQAPTITELYRCRWQGETFLKWIKQHLKINNFYSTYRMLLKFKFGLLFQHMC